MAIAEDKEVILRIRTRNITDSVEVFTARDLGTRIANDPIAYRAYRQLQRSGTDVVIDFGEPVTGEATGNAGVVGEVQIFARNIQSPQEAIATVVHESSHVRQLELGIQRYFGNTQYNEYRAFRREFLYWNGRRPTSPERASIGEVVRKCYSNLPEGRSFP